MPSGSCVNAAPGAARSRSGNASRPRARPTGIAWAETQPGGELGKGETFLEPDIIIDLSTLIFLGLQDGGALFLDDDSDLILFKAGGNKMDRLAATEAP